MNFLLIIVDPDFFYWIDFFNDRIRILSRIFTNYVKQPAFII